MKAAVFVSLLLLTVSSSACKPKAPEQPNKPPTPSASTVAHDNDTRPHLSSHIDTGGGRTQYDAYFDGPQLIEIKETGGIPAHAVAEYHYRGARLFKYTQTLPAGDATQIELDERGRVQRAMAGTRALAVDEIDAIRTRAQLLRSHALAQQASRMHGR